MESYERCLSDTSLSFAFAVQNGSLLEKRITDCNGIEPWHILDLDELLSNAFQSSELLDVCLSESGCFTSDFAVAVSSFFLIRSDVVRRILTTS